MGAKAVAAGVLLFAVSAASLIGGCGRTAVQPAAINQTGGDTGEDERGAIPGEASDEIQSTKERQLVVLFRSLLMMDKKPGLAIQKAQAAKLLPLIRKSVDAGQMSSSDMNKVVALLTGEQKAFVTSASSRLKRNVVSSQPPKGEGGESAGPANGKGQQVQSEGADDMEDDDWNSTDKSVEQLMIDLLESKLK